MPCSCGWLIQGNTSHGPGTFLQCHSLAQDQALAVLAALKLHSSKLCFSPVLKAALLCLSWHKESMLQVQLGVWGLTCLGDLCTEWLKYGYTFPSAGLLFQDKLPQGAVTGQLVINFHSFSRTFCSFRCGWFCFVLLFPENRDVKYHYCRKSVLILTSKGCLKNESCDSIPICPFLFLPVMS